MALRKALWALGVRYRKNRPDLPGKPDIVLARHRIAVFVDGDFWHGRNWEQRRQKLAGGANAKYWLAKIAANMARDVRNTAALVGAGWTVLRMWEGEVMDDPVAAALRVQQLLADGSARGQAGGG